MKKKKAERWNRTGQEKDEACQARGQVSKLKSTKKKDGVAEVSKKTESAGGEV